MKNLLFYLIKIFSLLQLKLFEIKLSNIQKKNSLKFKKIKSKYIERGDETLIINAKDIIKVKEIKDNLKSIIKSLKNIDAISKYINKKGTKIFKLKKPKKFLNFINEEEGFILPQKGFKALYINLLLKFTVNKKQKIKFNTPEMFILNTENSDIYNFLHQVYLWYGYKEGLEGYEAKNKVLLNQLLKSSNIENQLSFEDMFNLKKLIERDKEAVDFVVEFTKESEGTKNALSKLKNEGSTIL